MEQPPEEKKSEDGPMKFRGFDFFDTIPAENVQLENEYKDKVELTASMVQNEEVSWIEWYELKHLTNCRFIEAIIKKDIQSVNDMLDARKMPNGITADVNNRNEDDGTTPLHCAVQNRVPEVIQILLSYFVEVNTPDFQGRTALHLACEQNFIDEVQMLAEHEQTDIDFPDAQGNTPLHVACNFIHEPLILYLMNTAQANPEIKNLKAKLPLDVLKKRAGQNQADYLNLIKELVAYMEKGCDKSKRKITQQELKWHLEPANGGLKQM